VCNANTVSLLAVSSISEHAALKVGAGDGGETEGTGETLVTLGVVVLQGDLDINGFGEVTLLSLDFLTSLGDGLSGGVGDDVIDGLVEEGRIQLVRHDELEFVKICMAPTE